MNACKPTTRWARNFFTATVAGVLLGSASAIAAITAGQNDGSTILGTNAGDYCMQQVYSGSSISSSNLLNCTAQDVKISKATEFCVQALDSNNLPTGTPTAAHLRPRRELTRSLAMRTRTSCYGEVPGGRERELALRQSFYFRVDGGTARGTGG
jgi:hypothetical protein